MTNAERYFTPDDRASFIRQYASQFMAAYTAGRYDAACVTGNHDSLRRPPAEDALGLAEDAWNHLVDLDLVDGGRTTSPPFAPADPSDVARLVACIRRDSEAYNAVHPGKFAAGIVAPGESHADIERALRHVGLQNFCTVFPAIPAKLRGHTFTKGYLFNLAGSVTEYGYGQWGSLIASRTVTYPEHDIGRFESI